MTNEVISEQNEYAVTTARDFYIKGLIKSNALGDRSITLKVNANTGWYDGDAVKFTVIDAVFHCWLNLFIPVQWGDLPFPFSNPIIGDRIFGGDDRNFYNLPLIDPLTEVNLAISSSRIHQQVTIVPYKVLDADGLIDGSIKQAAGISHNYNKSLSVPYVDLGYSTSNRLLPTPVVTSSGTASGNQLSLQTTVTKSVVPQLQDTYSIINFGASADNPIVSPSFSIDWSFHISIGGNQLAPHFSLYGQHDGFPACEIYVRDSDGYSGGTSGTKILQFDPIPLGRTPTSLAEGIDDENVNEQGIIE